MSDLVEHLRRFDRKERNWLAQDAAGHPLLNLGFRERLNLALGECGLDVQVTPDAWWAIDYHLDWVFAALTSLAEPERRIFRNVEDERSVHGDQRDVDMIVAFARTIVLIEAKATGRWTGEQLRKKTGRLQLFGMSCQGATISGVRLYFASTSPKERPPRDVGWPGDLPWFPLHRPNAGTLLRPERGDCDEGAGWTANKNGRQWRLIGR